MTSDYNIWYRTHYKELGPQVFTDTLTLTNYQPDVSGMQDICFPVTWLVWWWQQRRNTKGHLQVRPEACEKTTKCPTGCKLHFLAGIFVTHQDYTRLSVVKMISSITVKQYSLALIDLCLPLCSFVSLQHSNNVGNCL